MRNTEKNTPTCVHLFMSINSKPETFYVQSMAAECDSGYIFLLEDQYVDPLVLNEILEANNSFPCNTD
ncbi:Hypothetical protein P9303_02921 [Prochlorococcus marinus str. MIT 9303]|uniref:Uncharacterized protein n=1 Tax=Prochlorococcus marinus (strain MIT 9303) TaxID=59922 RepID=A2C6D5_PROM3|nr:Hypothetical protein P9303_02921 [Prochlorococcus marinus str. MIT 9303]